MRKSSFNLIKRNENLILWVSQNNPTASVRVLWTEMNNHWSKKKGKKLQWKKKLPRDWRVSASWGPSPPQIPQYCSVMVLWVSGGVSIVPLWCRQTSFLRKTIRLIGEVFSSLESTFTGRYSARFSTTTLRGSEILPFNNFIVTRKNDRIVKKGHFNAVHSDGYIHMRLQCVQREFFLSRTPTGIFLFLPLTNQCPCHLPYLEVPYQHQQRYITSEWSESSSYWRSYAYCVSGFDKKQTAFNS